MRRAAGFTLIEVIVVITIMAILATGVAVFMSGPINAYFDSATRAELTDAADTALRRLSRDVRLALPNSARVSINGANTYLEFVQTLSGGQYRRNDNCFTAGVGCNALTALAATLPNLANTALDGRRVVLYNINNNAGGDCSDDAPSVYCAAANNNPNNLATINSHAVNAGELTLSFSAATVFHPSRSLSSPGQRFQVIDGPVSYVCAPATTGNNGSGSLRRIAGYNLAAAQPTAFTAEAGSLIANNVSGCTITYAEGVQSSQGLITLWLQLTRNGETVSLFHQIHVDNAP